MREEKDKKILAKIVQWYGFGMASISMLLAFGHNAGWVLFALIGCVIFSVGRMME